jgi:hypothetical protein
MSGGGNDHQPEIGKDKWGYRQQKGSVYLQSTMSMKSSQMTNGSFSGMDPGRSLEKSSILTLLGHIIISTPHFYVPSCAKFPFLLSVSAIPSFWGERNLPMSHGLIA